MMLSNRIIPKYRFINPLSGPRREGREATRRYRMKSNSQDLPPPLPPCKQAPSAQMGSAAAHTWLCQIPVQDASGSEHSEPCGADSPVPANGRCEESSWGGEGGERERLRAQLPANTRAHSISPRPSDDTSHCPAPAHKHTRMHTSPPWHPLCPPSSHSLLCCAPLLAMWGTEDAAF